MASEGDKIFVGKIVVGTDPAGELTKDDWAVVVGKVFLLFREKVTHELSEKLLKKTLMES